MTVAEASEKWGVSLRQVPRLVAANRIPGAQNFGTAWMLPVDAEKPADPRRERRPPESLLPSDLPDVTAAATDPCRYITPTRF